MRYLVCTLALVVLVLSIGGCHAHDPATQALQAEALALHDSLVVIETQVRESLAQAATEGDTLRLAPSIRDSLDAVTGSSRVLSAAEAGSGSPTIPSRRTMS